MSPQEKAREIVDKLSTLLVCEEHLAIDLITKALTLPQVDIDGDECNAAAFDYTTEYYGDSDTRAAFKAGAKWCLKKLKGE